MGPTSHSIHTRVCFTLVEHGLWCLNSGTLNTIWHSFALLNRQFAGLSELVP